MAKVIQIKVEVYDAEENYYEVDRNFEPEYITVSYEDEDAEMVYAEAGELAGCIEKLVTS